MIGNLYNYSDVFFRDVTTGLLDTLESTVKYYNRFEKEDHKIIDVPFYYALVGHETFLLDTFDDNIVNENRLNSMNVDVIPRGHITWKSTTIKSEEVANPNIKLNIVENINDEIITTQPYIRAIPLKFSYECVILVDTEIEAMKVSQALIDTLWLYCFFDIEYKGMIIPCVLEVPDDNSIDINREVQFGSGIKKSVSLNIEVHTNYPAYLKPVLNIEKLEILKKTKWYSNIKKGSNN